MSTRKEVFRKSIRFESPEYIPLLYYGTEERRLNKSDAIMLPVEEMYGGTDGRLTEWGFSWVNSDSGYLLGVVDEPAITDWSMLDKYTPLDAKRKGRFDESRKIMQMYPDRYFMADFILSGFTIASFVRGFEDFLADIYLDRKNVEKLCDIVFAAEEELIRECACAGFDGICLADDWGTQTGLLISKKSIDEIFMPRYKHQIEVAHSLGLDVMMHSCGYIYDIIPGFIAAGLDVLNPGQPALNGIERLGEAFSGKLCFGCPIGYQTTGIQGTPDDIRAEVASYVKHLSTDKGGYIGLVGTADAMDSLGASKENIAMLEPAFEELCGKRDINII